LRKRKGAGNWAWVFPSKFKKEDKKEKIDWPSPGKVWGGGVVCLGGEKTWFGERAPERKEQGTKGTKPKKKGRRDKKSQGRHLPGLLRWTEYYLIPGGKGNMEKQPRGTSQRESSTISYIQNKRWRSHLLGGTGRVSLEVDRGRWGGGKNKKEKGELFKAKGEIRGVSLGRRRGGSGVTT